MIERDPISGELRRTESKQPDLSKCTYLTFEQCAADPVIALDRKREKQLREAEAARRDIQSLPRNCRGGDIRSSFARGKR